MEHDCLEQPVYDNLTDQLHCGKCTRLLAAPGPDGSLVFVQVLEEFPAGEVPPLPGARRGED